MSVTYLIACGGTFYLKDWKGMMPPDHPLRPLMCWLSPKRVCTTQCAACSVEILAGPRWTGWASRPDSSYRDIQRVHCKALWKAPCIGFLDEQDQLRAQLEEA
jgi:hypothetical protein